MTFHTEFGTIAGVAAPEVGSLVVERPADRRPLGWTVVADGVFVAPNAFLVDATGLVLRTNGSPKGEISARRGPAGARDRRRGPARVGRRDRALATEDLSAVLAAADALRSSIRSSGDPVLTPISHRANESGSAATANCSSGTPPVTDRVPRTRSCSTSLLNRARFGTSPWSAGTSRPPGCTTTGGRRQWDHRRMGLVEDARIASVVLRRDGMPDLAARITGGTFLIAGPDLTDLPERGPVTAVLVARDHSRKRTRRASLPAAGLTRPHGRTWTNTRKCGAWT